VEYVCRACVCGREGKLGRGGELAERRRREGGEKCATTLEDAILINYLNI